MRTTGLLIGCAALLFTASCSEKTPLATSSDEPVDLFPTSKLTVSGSKMGGTPSHRSAVEAPSLSRRELRFDEPISIDRMAIEWLDVTDSRCPAGFECITAGEVTVKIGVTLDEQEIDPISLTLYPGDRARARVDFGSHSIELLDVTPLPKSGPEIQRSEYAAILAIGQTGRSSSHRGFTTSTGKAGGYRHRRSDDALPPNPKPDISPTELPEQLVAFEWNLESHAPIGEELHPHPEGEVSLKIAPNGRIEGSGGCNTYFARAIPGEGNLLGIGDLGFTEMACLDPEGVMDREISYFSLLSTVSSYTVERDRLTLFYDDDRGVLNFVAGDEAPNGPIDEEPGIPLPDPNEPPEFPNPDIPPEFPVPEEPRPEFPDSLVTFDWRLESVGTTGESVPVLSGTEITLNFAFGGELRGSAGCNSYFAGYELGEDARILIQQIGTTRMACGDPEGVMAQESQYLIALSQATFFAIDDERLTLFDRERNATLHFAAVE